ncbi:MAG: hypothetical protein WCJ30_20220, partial [Deltaproteobacteria bacterium]
MLARRPRDRLIYFSLDLVDTPAARVKVYIAHVDGGADDLELVLSLSPHHEAGDAARLCRALAGTTG